MSNKLLMAIALVGNTFASSIVNEAELYYKTEYVQESFNKAPSWIKMNYHLAMMQYFKTVNEWGLFVEDNLDKFSSDEEMIQDLTLELRTLKIVLYHGKEANYFPEFVEEIPILFVKIYNGYKEEGFASEVAIRKTRLEFAEVASIIEFKLRYCI